MSMNQSGSQRNAKDELLGWFQSNFDGVGLVLALLVACFMCIAAYATVAYHVRVKAFIEAGYTQKWDAQERQALWVLPREDCE